MSQGTKSAQYQALKAQGVPFEKQYRDYTTAELRELAQANGLEPVADVTPAGVPPRTSDMAELKQQLDGLSKVVLQLAHIVSNPQVAPPVSAPQPMEKPVQAAPARRPALDPNEHAGLTLNSHNEFEVIRTDEFGNQWYRNEVPKPAFPKQRVLRVLTEMDSGVKKETIQVGGYTETFEVPGDPEHARPIEVKVALPAFQTGIFKPRDMPFRVHIYNGVRGFDFTDVNAFYGGQDQVPAEVKRTYVANDLCYDILTVRRAIENEYRERVLKKETLR